MTDFHVFLSVGVALSVALVCGELADRAGEPIILGEIIAGVLLGTHLIGVVDPASSFGLFAAVGSVLLLFDAGYEEIEIHDFTRASRSIVGLVVWGVLLPAAAGFGLGRWFGYDQLGSTVLAIAMGVTSIGITARILLDLDSIQTPAGVSIVGTSISAETVGLMAFSLLLAAAHGGLSTAAIVRIVGLVALFFVITYLLYRFGIGWLSSVLTRSHQPNVDLLAIMSLLFLFAAAADAAGLDIVIGGLLAGLVVSSESRFHDVDIREGIVGIAYGVFIPLFFVNIGAQLDPRVILQVDPFILAVVILGVVSKLGGGYVGARIAGFRSDEALVVGVGLIPRAGVELVVVTGALAAGIVDERLFTAVLVLVFVSVLTTPVLLKRAIARISS